MNTKKMPSMPVITPTGGPTPPVESNDLTTPNHEEATLPSATLQDPEVSLANKATLPAVSSRGIKVVAQRNGFYNQDRKRAGDIFYIKSAENFGNWFTCEEPEQEALRVEFIRNKKAKKK